MYTFIEKSISIIFYLQNAEISFGFLDARIASLMMTQCGAQTAEELRRRANHQRIETMAVCV
jgi:hypothetical protein